MAFAVGVFVAVGASIGDGVRVCARVAMGVGSSTLVAF